MNYGAKQGNPLQNKNHNIRDDRNYRSSNYNSRHYFFLIALDRRAYQVCVSLGCYTESEIQDSL